MIRSPCLYLRMRSQIARRAYGSTPAVGSSKITARDPPTNAIATDNFLFIPPDRVWTRLWRLLDNSRSSIILWIPTHRLYELKYGCDWESVRAKCECDNPLIHLLLDIFFSHALQTRVEPQMFLYTELIEEYIVLGTHAQILPDTLHLCADVMAVYGGRARGGWKQSREYRPIRDSLYTKWIFCRKH